MIDPRRLALVGALVLVACGPANPDPVDAGADGATTTDAGSATDAGAATDAGSATDAGADSDAGAATDAAADSDAGSGSDAGAMDAGAMDAGAIDAGRADAGLTDAGVPPFDPCAELDCTVAPSPVCLDATRLTTSTPTGTCAAGTCGTTTTTTTCGGHCAEGACVTAPCGSTTCAAPGGPTCVSAQDLLLPYDVGTCVADACTYPGWTATCSGGCAGTGCAPGSWLTHVRDTGRAFWTCSALDPEERPHIFYFGMLGASQALLETALMPSGWVTRTIETAIGPGLHHPLDCAIDRTGTAHVVYEDRVSTSVRYARRPRGGAWTVEFVAAGATRAFALLMRDLVPVAVFGDGSGIAVAERTAGGWVEERRAARSAGNAVAAFDGSGEVVIAITNVSSSSAGDPTQSQLGLPDATGGWTFENTVEVGWIDDIVIDRATDTIELTLSNLSPDFLDVHTRTADGRWTQALVGGSLGDGRQGRLEVEADGTLHVVFNGRCGTAASPFGVCHAVRGSGGGYTVRLAGDSLRGRSTSFALDGAGDPHIAGPSNTLSDDLIYLRPY